LDDKTRERLVAALGIALAALLLWVLYAYIFIWHNTPNLERLLKPYV